jgi:hypothetical protein
MAFIGVPLWHPFLRIGDGIPWFRLSIRALGMEAWLEVKALVHIYALRSLNDFGRWVIKSKKSHSVLIGWLVK